MSDNWLNKKEVAKRLGMSERTIDRFRSAGYDLGEKKLPTGTVKFRQSVIESILQDGFRKKR